MRLVQGSSCERCQHSKRSDAIHRAKGLLICYAVIPVSWGQSAGLQRRRTGLTHRRMTITRTTFTASANTVCGMVICECSLHNFLESEQL